jgi:hypothetical protein
VDETPLAPEEPLSPELVLVLPPDLRLRAIAALGEPVWPTPRPQAAGKPPELRLVEPAVRPLPAAAPAPLEESWARSFGTLVAARLVQLGLIFVVVTIATLVLTLVAQAFR